MFYYQDTANGTNINCTFGVGLNSCVCAAL